MLNKLLLIATILAAIAIAALKWELNGTKLANENLVQKQVLNKENTKRKTFEIEQKTIIETKKKEPYEKIPTDNGKHTININE